METFLFGILRNILKNFSEMKINKNIGHVKVFSISYFNVTRKTFFILF